MASSPLISGAYNYNSTTLFLILNKKRSGPPLPSSSFPIFLLNKKKRGPHHHPSPRPYYPPINASNQPPPSPEFSDRNNNNQNNVLTTTTTSSRAMLRDMCGGINGIMKRLEGWPISAAATILLILVTNLQILFNYWNPWFVPSANAVLYSPDTKVPRTGELALRRAIPANANMKAIQDSLEDISFLLRIPQRKPYGTMEGDVKKALKIAKEEKESILGSIPEEFKEKGSLLYNSLIDGKGGLQNLIQFIKQNDPDKVSVGLASSLDTIAEIELLQAPGLSFLLPEQYLKYPRLTGRATVEFTIEKGDGSTFFPTAGGQPQTLATIQVILDGYSAPLTAGNFAKLVLDGAYDGVNLKCTDQAVIVDSKPGNTGYSVPLEVMPSGQFEPLYKTSLSIQDGELPVLPLSVYGSVAMAHGTDSEEYSSPSQFFFYLYDKRNAGLGGLSFDEGQFSVFGYTTIGREVLPQIKSGDLIRSAKLVDGRDRLILPADSDRLLS